MDLREAIQQATPGPFKAGVQYGRATTILAGDGSWIAEFEHVPDEDRAVINSVLLAHCRTHFEELVNMLKKAEEQIFNGTADRYICAQIDALIRDISDVNVPKGCDNGKV